MQLKWWNKWEKICLTCSLGRRRLLLRLLWKVKNWHRNTFTVCLGCTFSNPCSEFKYKTEPDLVYSNYYNMKRICKKEEIKCHPDIEEVYGNDGDQSERWLPLSPHPNFDDSPVNLDHSAVHVPINVYEVSLVSIKSFRAMLFSLQQASEILNHIKWSEELTQTFRNNFANDPTLSWQFFGSSKGFIRIYPSKFWQSVWNIQLMIIL